MNARAIRLDLSTRREHALCALSALDLPTPDGVLDDHEAATVAEQADAIADRRTRLQTTVRLLDQAIERLASGAYGVCVDCGELIAPKRLAAIPEIETCLACQVVRERNGDGQGVLARVARVRRPRALEIVACGDGA